MDVRRAIAEELHAPARRNFLRRKVTLKGLNDLYQGDLVEVQPYSRQNHGMRYILTVINCFSKLGFAIPLKDKTGLALVKCLEPILKDHKMKFFHTDQGKEFFNRNVQMLFKKYGVNHYSTFSDKKASIVERFNRTLKGALWKELTVKGNYKWLSVLPGIVNKYNNTRHRTIGMKPKDVRQKHVKALLARLNKKEKSTKPKFKVDEEVRLNKLKRTFSKAYTPNWTNEVFKILAVRPTVPPTYILQDNHGEILKGGFYEQELQRSKLGDVYLIEKVLKRKGNKMYVRWLGYDKKHDTWIKKSDLI